MKTPAWRKMRISIVVVLIGWTVAACSRGGVSASAAAFGAGSGSGSGSGSADHGFQEVIYGDDNRTDYYDETNAGLKALSESTVALMSTSQISSKPVNGMRLLTGTNYQKSLGLCSDERFVDQNTGAFCSGFLITSQLVVTAGHCIPDLKSCGETSFVFGYRIDRAGSLPSSVSDGEVYSCASLLHSQSPSDGADFAVVKLDRPVTNHAPMTFAPSGSLNVGDGVTVMGYPEGLPLKIADGATVRSNAGAGFFVANTDSYGGNSGSAVVNATTRQVEGVLVRGEKDYVWTPDGCARSYKCKADACRGEDVTRIDEVLKAVGLR